MTNNLTPARFVRMVGEWMDAGGYVVPVDLYEVGSGAWICRVGYGQGLGITANWDRGGTCTVVMIGEWNAVPTEQGLTDALIELACRMEERK